jgi:hypothetical protein
MATGVGEATRFVTATGVTVTKNRSLPSENLR